MRRVVVEWSDVFAVVGIGGTPHYSHTLHRLTVGVPAQVPAGAGGPPAYAQPQRVYVRTRVPILTALCDVFSKRENVYTAGNIVRLRGDDMKFNDVNRDEGVFLINMANQEVTRIMSYASMGSREIVFLMPGNATDAMAVEVRTRYGSETIRTGRLPVLISPA